MDKMECKKRLNSKSTNRYLYEIKQKYNMSDVFFSFYSFLFKLSKHERHNHKKSNN